MKPLSILTRLSHHSIIEPEPSPAEMIVMVVQPHPAGGRTARRHCEPSDAGLLPADVPPFSGDTIIYSLVAYPMGAGRTRIAPGKQTEKGGRKTENRKRCGNLAAACHWWKFWVCGKNRVSLSLTTKMGRRFQCGWHTVQQVTTHTDRFVNIRKSRLGGALERRRGRVRSSHDWRMRQL